MMIALMFLTIPATLIILESCSITYLSRFDSLDYW